MTTDKAKELSEDTFSRLMDTLERGRSEALKAYLRVMSHFHKYGWRSSKTRQVN